MAFTAIFDACVLYPASLRDFLIRLAMTDLFRGRWTNAILDECFRSILRQRPDLTAAALERTRDLMVRAVRNCLVEGHEPLIDGLDLPDPDDRHVLAAAIRCGAQVIVTTNLADFPPEKLAQYEVEAQHPDDFVLNLIDLDAVTVVRIIHDQAASLRSPPFTAQDVLAALERSGLAVSVARIRELLGHG